MNHVRSSKFLFAVGFVALAGCGDPEMMVDPLLGSSTSAMETHHHPHPGGPRLVTDREDYTTGLTVHLLGKELTEGAVLTVRIERPDGTEVSYLRIADHHGNIEAEYIFDGQQGNYEAQLIDETGAVLARTHFHGSHFRYGHLTWRAKGVRQAELSLVSAFRRSGYSGSGSDGLVVTGDTFSEAVGDTALCFGDGACTGVLRFEAIAYDVGLNWVIGRAVSPGGTQELPGTGVTVQEVEPNDTFSTANSMRMGDDYACTIASSGNRDTVRFTLAAQTTVNIRTRHVTMRDSYLYLYSQSGTLIAQDDDSGGSLTSYISRNLPAGTYYIQAAGFSSNTGSMRVELRGTAVIPPGPLTHQFPGNGLYTSGIDSCCRIGFLENQNETYRVQSVVRFDIQNSSPVSSLPPIVNAPVNKPDFTFTVPAADPDGDTLRFRLATFSESGIDNPISGLTVNPTTGVVSWSTVGKSVGQYWTTQIIIEELRNGAVIGRSGVDFLIRIVPDIGRPPACTLNPPQTAYTVTTGQPVSFSVTGTDPDSGDTLMLNTGGIPSGATLTPRLPLTGPSGIRSTFNWVPSTTGASVVSFNVSDANGQSAQCAVAITVNASNRPPQANAGPDQAVNEGATVALAGSGSDPDGDSLSYSWALVSGSGPAVTLSSTTSPGPTFATSDDGVYTFRLTVSDGRGGTSSDEVTVTVNNVAPSVSALGGTINEATVFGSNGSFSDPGADSWTVTVDYGDGIGATPLSSTGSFALSHFYDDNGVYPVTVTVRDDDGGVGVASAVVIVYNVAPTASATASSASQYWGIAVDFSGTASDPSAADTAAGLQPTWSFSDGASSAGLTASHAFANPGAHSGTLTVTDKDGASGTAVASVTINKRPTSLSCTGGTVTFGSSATLAAQLGDALPGARLGQRGLSFSLNGQAIGSALTDDAGQASVQSPGMLAPGSYTVSVAFAEDSHYTASEGTCTLLVLNSVGKVTGGGLRAANSRGRGGFNVQNDGVAPISGELQYQDDNTRFHAHTVTSLGISADGKSAWLAGTGVDGRSFTAYVEDNGEPGRNDVFKIWIDGTLHNGNGVLIGGNIQIH